MNLADGIAEAPVVSAVPDFGHGRGQWPAASSLGGGPRLARCVLRGEPSSPKVARDFTDATLSDWGLAGLLEDTQMVVSELVTNAIRHGLTSGSSRPGSFAPMLQLVLLRHDRRLVTVVTDPGDRAPALADRADFAESGRGLRIVAALSGSWGWAPLVTGGKAVWAAFDLPAA